MKNLKTLVIHPKDFTTAFLSPIYAGRGWAVIQDRLPCEVLKGVIKEYDRIIMLGHGTPDGLLYDVDGYVIDESFVPLLMEKINSVFIWCNANYFVERFGLYGFYTGMIISEMVEALMFEIDATPDDISFSNMLFADSIKHSILNDPEQMKIEVKQSYKSMNNVIVNFNSANIFSSILV